MAVVKLSEHQLIRCVLTSSTWQQMDRQSFIALSQRNRRYRADKGITGLMLYEDGNVFQILEGTAEAIDNACRHIHHDYVYKNVLKLSQRQVSRREFHGLRAAYGICGREAFTCVDSNQPYFLGMEEFKALKSSHLHGLLKQFLAGKWRLQTSDRPKNIIQFKSL